MPMSMSEFARHGEKTLDVRILHLIATVIEFCGPPREGAPGHPPAETIRVLATLRRFLPEGTPWRSLTATAAQASGAGPLSAAPLGGLRLGAERSAMTGSASSFSHCFKPHVSSWLKDASRDNSESRLL